MTEKKQKLTFKQERFTDEIIKTAGNATQAAINAGYSKKTATEMGYENLTKPHIKKEIQERVQSAAEKLGITPEYVLNNLKEIADFNKKEMSVPMGSGENTIINKTMVNPNACLKANELIGKHLKMFVERTEAMIEIKEEEISSERLLALARKTLALLNDPNLTKSK